MHRQPKKQQSRHELIHGHLLDEQTCPSPTTNHPAKFNRCGVARNTKNQSYCRWPNNKPPCSHHTTRQPSRRNKNRIIYKSSTNDPHNNPINLSLNELHAHAIRFRTQLKFGLRCLKFAALSNNFYLQKIKRNSSNAKFYDFLLRAHIYISSGPLDTLCPTTFPIMQKTLCPQAIYGCPNVRESSLG